MKILYLGDFKKMNGPSMVDINLTNKLEDKVLKVQIDGKYMPILKDIKNSDIVNISGVSAKGVVCSIFSKIYGKKVTYIMHGGLKIESKYRNIKFNRKLYEIIILKFSNKVICVSEKFEEKIKEEYNLKNTTYINNGIDIKKDIKECEIKKEKHQILTVGGGRQEKGILNICKAVELLNNVNIKLIVVGEDGRDTEHIKAYSFVEYKGFVSHNELLTLMEKSNIFIQNSYCESFGITVLEAMMNQCNIIISKDVGAPIEHLEDYTVDSDDINKISMLLSNLLNDNSKQNIDMKFVDNLTWDVAAENYLNIWSHMINNKNK